MEARSYRIERGNRTRSFRNTPAKARVESNGR